MPRYPKKPTFRYWIYDSEGNLHNLEDLPPEKQEEIKQRNYETLVRALGYVPVERKEENDGQRELYNKKI